MLLALGLSVVLGLWNGFLVAVLGIQPIIATLVLMTAGRGIAQLITDGQIITVANPCYASSAAGSCSACRCRWCWPRCCTRWSALVTRRTALGMLIEAVGINPSAARLTGIRARGITVAVYVFVAVCACLAGLMISSNVTAADANNAGLWIELDAILAVVIGGTLLTGGRYSVVGTLVGALVLQTLTTTVYTAGIPPEVTLVFKALVIIAVCLLQSPKTRALLRAVRARRPGPRAVSRVVSAEDHPRPRRSPRARAASLDRAPRRRLASPRCCPCWPRSCCSCHVRGRVGCATTASSPCRCCSTCSSTTPT